MAVLTMIITVEAETGEVISVTDGSGNPAARVNCAQLKEKYPKYLGAISHFSKSPGCICYDFFGTCFQICTP